jgi:hypothetical protein
LSTNPLVDGITEGKGNGVDTSNARCNTPPMRHLYACLPVVTDDRVSETRATVGAHRKCSYESYVKVLTL